MSLLQTNDTKYQNYNNLTNIPTGQGFDFIIDNGSNIIGSGYKGTVISKYAGNISSIEIYSLLSGDANITIGNSTISFTGSNDYFNNSLLGITTFEFRQPINITVNSITNFTKLTISVNTVRT